LSCYACASSAWALFHGASRDTSRVRGHGLPSVAACTPPRGGALVTERFASRGEIADLLRVPSLLLGQIRRTDATDAGTRSRTRTGRRQPCPARSKADGRRMSLWAPETAPRPKARCMARAAMLETNREETGHRWGWSFFRRSGASLARGRRDGFLHQFGKGGRNERGALSTLQ
jgi:hypothetical protein